MNKLKNKIAMFMLMGFIIPMNVSAAETPTFDSGAAQEGASGFITPFMDFALWAIPIVGGLAWAIAGLMWLTKDEEEKEQKSFMKTSKRIIVVSIVVECIPALLKIFGIA